MSKKNSKINIKGLVFFLFLAIASVVGAWQFDVVREFFSRASGTPAVLEIDTQAVIGTMPRPWRNLSQGGEDHAWRIQPILNQVRALNPDYIRLDHVFDFYDVVSGGPGNLSFDFSKLDLVLDDIQAAGAIPYISLSYMPPAISVGDIVEKPQNYSDWQLVVQKTIEHISGTRGTNNVYYEVWNEPDLFGKWRYYGDKNYLDLYSASVRGANSARGVRNFKIGGPAITDLYQSWFDAFLEFAIKNNLRLDFFSWHKYTSNPMDYSKDMMAINKWMEKYPQLQPTLEFHITEWGHDSENNGGYDNNYSAAHTVTNAISMMGVIQKAFVFEIQDGKDPKNSEYWGRWGLITHNDFGAKTKPRYLALRMLDRLSDQRLALNGQGTFVKAAAAKADDGSTQVVIANFDKNGRNRENVPVIFKHLTPGSYTLNLRYLNGKILQLPLTAEADSAQTFVQMNPNDVVWAELKKN